MNPLTFSFANCFELQPRQAEVLLMEVDEIFNSCGFCEQSENMIHLLSRLVILYDSLLDTFLRGDVTKNLCITELYENGSFAVVKKPSTTRVICFTFNGGANFATLTGNFVHSYKDKSVIICQPRAPEEFILKPLWNDAPQFNQIYKKENLTYY